MAYNYYYNRKRDYAHTPPFFDTRDDTKPVPGGREKKAPPFSLFGFDKPLLQEEKKAPALLGLELDDILLLLLIFCIMRNGNGNVELLVVLGFLFISGM